MLFAPTINYMSEWFDKRKSLAYGIMYVLILPKAQNSLTLFKMWHGWPVWCHSSTDLQRMPPQVRIQSNNHRMVDRRHHLNRCRRCMHPVQIYQPAVSQSINIRLRFLPQPLVLHSFDSHADSRPGTLRPKHISAIIRSRLWHVRISRISRPQYAERCHRDWTAAPRHAGVSRFLNSWS